MNCVYCGAMIDDGGEYCKMCGEKVNKTAPIQNIIKIQHTQGSERRFPLLGQEIVVSKELDTYNFYLQQFKHMAYEGTERVRQDYEKAIHNLDEFFLNFPTMYQFYIQPIIKEAFDILVRNDIFSVSVEDFTNTHTETYGNAINSYKYFINVFNETIANNQSRISAKMSLIPNIFLFGSVAGLVASVAFNAAMTGVERNAIKNANVSIQQRNDIFSSIDVHMLLCQVFDDYWNVYQTTNYFLHMYGKRVWINSQELQKQATNIFTNSCNPIFPQDKVVDNMISAMELSPYNDNFYKTLIGNYGKTQEIVDLCRYFGYEYLI